MGNHPKGVYHRAGCAREVALEEVVLEEFDPKENIPQVVRQKDFHKIFEEREQ